MAIGDIISINIVPSGWFTEILISGMNPSGSYNTGISGYNTNPSGAKAIFYVTSSGYDDSGNPTTLNRTIYGTRPHRKLWPNNSVFSNEASGTNVLVRLNLSEYIYQKDVNITATFLSGFYSDAIRSCNSISGLVCTNNSNQPYPRVIANWTYPSRDVVTSGIYLRAQAYHGSGRDKKPVKCIKFLAEDQHSNTYSTIITTPTLVSGIIQNDPILTGILYDPVPVIEYTTMIPTSGFTQNDLITCNFIAYPHYGDSTTLINTSDGSNGANLAEYSPQYYLCNKNNTYPRAMAYVDSVNGNDTSGQVILLSGFNPLSPPIAYKTIALARNAIQTYNNSNYSRSDMNASVLYLASGSYSWTGSTTGTRGNYHLINCTVTSFPGLDRSFVTITGRAGDRDVAQFYKLSNLTVQNNLSTVLTEGSGVWINDCIINGSGIGILYNGSGILTTDIYHYTFNIQNKTLPNGFRVYGTNSGAFGIVRGNTINVQESADICSHVYTGNIINSGVMRYTTHITTPGYKWIPPQFPIVSFNKHYLATSQNEFYNYENNLFPTSGGLAVIQNIFEASSNQSNSLLSIGIDNTGITTVSNIIFANNIFVGQRSNICYNDPNSMVVSIPAPRNQWFFFNNILESINIISDEDSHGAPSPDAMMHGNWSFLNGVGCFGNFYPENGESGGEGLNPPNFPGLYSWSIYEGDPAIDPNYFNDKSYITGSGTGGHGDYHMSSGSLGLQLAKIQYLPYDIDGHPRYTNGSAGPYIGLFDFGNSITKAIIYRFYESKFNKQQERLKWNK